MIFNARSLIYFSALANVQKLGTDDSDLPTFIPQAQLYRGHPTQALHFLALGTPKVPTANSHISSDYPQTLTVSSTSTVVRGSRQHQTWYLSHDQPFTARAVGADVVW